MGKALVTGANGFIGSFLTQKLIHEGLEVRVLARKTSNLRWIKDLPIEIFYGGFSDPSSLSEAVKEVDYVFHAAASKRAFAESEYDEVNYLGTRNLLAACLKGNPSLKRFLYLSSLEVVGPATADKPANEETACKPITFYGSSKLKGEKEVLGLSEVLPVTIIRPPAVYGPRDEDFLTIFKAIARRVEPCIGIKDKHFSLCYIDDLIEGLWLASKKESAAGKTYFIADEHVYSYREFTRSIAEALGIKSFKVVIPDALVLAAGCVNDLLARIKGKPATLNWQKACVMVQEAWLCDVSKAKKELGFQTQVSLKEGIQRTVNWYRSQGWL